jgi:hypothetical protein
LAILPAAVKFHDVHEPLAGTGEEDHSRNVAQPEAALAAVPT